MAGARERLVPRCRARRPSARREYFVVLLLRRSPALELGDPLEPLENLLDEVPDAGDVGLAPPAARLSRFLTEHIAKREDGEHFAFPDRRRRRQPGARARCASPRSVVPLFSISRNAGRGGKNRRPESGPVPRVPAVNGLE